jgi:hypothetical protein
VTDLALKALELLTERLDSAETLTELVAVIDDAKDFASEATTVARQAEAELATRMGDDNQVEVAGVGVLKRRWQAGKTVWDHRLAISAVIDAAMDQGTHPREAIMACAGISYWRTGELKRFDLDPRTYRRSEGQGRYTVQVIR